MNEPNKQTALEWVKTDNAIAAAIRATGATNKIIFPGTAWDGAWTWVTSGNATQMLKAYDPGNNYAFEAHQYLDRDGSGTSPTCVADSGAARLAPFTTWLQKYGLHGIIGEVGWAANDGCATEANALLNHWRAATTSTVAGGYIGLTYWAAGPWWPDGYMYLAEPRPFPAGSEPVQLKTLKSYLSR
jgi:endoglucanase